MAKPALKAKTHPHFRDLRDFIDLLEETGNLYRIGDRIDKNSELMPLVRWQYQGLPDGQRKAFLFENVTDPQGRDYDCRVAVGALGASREIYKMALGVAEDNHAGAVAERWNHALSRPIPPRIVKSGPVKEVILKGRAVSRPDGGVLRFPVPISNPGFDGGPFLTAPYVVTKDPETGVANVGTYRCMIKGPDKLGVSVSPAQHIGIHFHKCKEKKVPLQAAIVLGCAPAIGLASVAKVGYDRNEYAVAGGIAGEAIALVKCESVDLEVPARAEIVIEGEIPTGVMEPEGPFGEFTGYMGGQLMNGIFLVKCITHRKDPILQMFTEGVPSESGVMRKMGYESTLYKLLKYDCNIPSVLNVTLHESSGSRKFVVIRMKKTNPAQPWQALQAAVALDPSHGKILVTVDEDIDSEDADSVNWALSFRMQPHRDVKITTHKFAGLDPSAAPPGSSHTEARFPSPSGCSAIMIDATRKWPYPPVALPSKKYMEAARAKWEKLGLPPLKPKMPWYGYSLGHWDEEDVENAESALRGDYQQVAERLQKKAIKI
ncbi:MAG: UbiD family decarboxylase [Deltaproteobacteria bacterium]|nr:UbiD family decarboxylase [Deltaproteobacteria bacterium]MBI2181358.1 UbiD family decarboxylase [Deltaproteobacteria bacterium]MBI2531992.1 UbiD family decarboxylase [Deltaproteobacteria bacterium]MBI3064966.1 UbiD family decarboxylase [Deltaproteobacteria bacterium]